MTNHMNELKGRDLDTAIAKEIFGFLPREEDLRTEELIPFHSDLNRALALCKKVGLGLRASELPVTPEEISWKCLEHWRLVGVLSDDVFGDKDTWAEPSELVFDSFRGSGQKTNQCESGVKVTHLPTGLSSEFDGHRSHLQNREEALRLLKEKVQEGIALMFLSCGVVVNQETVSWDTWVEYRKQVAEWNEKKPPIGVEPQYYWEENYPEPTNEQIIERMKELNGAIFRYYGAGRSPLREWIEEFYSLSSKIK